MKLSNKQAQRLAMWGENEFTANLIVTTDSGKADKTVASLISKGLLTVTHWYKGLPFAATTTPEGFELARTCYLMQLLENPQ